VFVSLAARGPPALRSWRTSSGVASHRSGPKASRYPFPSASRKKHSVPERFACTRRCQHPDVPRPFLGRSPLARRFVPGGTMPLRKPDPALPAPLTGWSGRSRWRSAASSPRRAVQPRTRGSFHRLPAEIGSSVPSSPSRRCRLSGRRGRPPRSRFETSTRLRVAQSGIFGCKPVDNGDMAHNLSESPAPACHIPG
jgi:hypothetical protein